MTIRRFPKDFLWGVAAASYQIEGAVDKDGRSPSIWDTFSATPGKVENGDTGAVACDHYHRWRDDIALMRDLGVKTYRFSIAWPRILPQGSGAVNATGLDWYDRLVDGLLEAGITPFATLYHWDLPQALQDRGGWTSRETGEAFVCYADVVSRRIGDRVKHWITHNEPWVVSYVGNFYGTHAPGLRDLKTTLQVAHTVLVSHGAAVPVIRATSPGAQVGITLNLSPVSPASARPEDVLAAQRADGALNRWFLDPVHGRGYPADMLELFEPYLPEMQPQDQQLMGVATDFLGINYYSPNRARHVPLEQSPLGYEFTSPQEELAAGRELTAMGWVVEPNGLLRLLTSLHSSYAPPLIYITENGAAFDDQLIDGRVHDPQRIAYLRGHLSAVHQAIQAGVPVQGYMLWSILDNFEWALGYGKRFGVVYVDYATQRRVPKDSALWYRQVIADNALDDGS